MNKWVVLTLVVLNTTFVVSQTSQTTFPREFYPREVYWDSRDLLHVTLDCSQFKGDEYETTVMAIPSSYQSPWCGLCIQSVRFQYQSIEDEKYTRYWAYGYLAPGKKTKVLCEAAVYIEYEEQETTSRLQRIHKVTIVAWVPLKDSTSVKIFTMNRFRLSSGDLTAAQYVYETVDERGIKALLGVIVYDELPNEIYVWVDYKPKVTINGDVKSRFAYNCSLMRRKEK